MSDHDIDSDSDHSMDDVQEENAVAEDMQAIETLTSSLEGNPYQYNVYTELFALLKKQGMLEELRTARSKMNAIYPLSEELWMDWIQDEAKLAYSAEEKQAVIDLYEKATMEYLSIPIWMSYIEFMVQGREDAAEGDESTLFTVDQVRAVFGKAYDATKWHVAKSHLIWNPWLAFEMEIFSDNASSDDIQRVRKMCVDRLGVPHLELEKTFSEEVSTFVSNHLPADYENTMVELRGIVAQTRKALSKVEPFEQSLIDTQNSVAAYRDYIRYESHHNVIDYSKLKTLYERAVASHPLVPALWDDYLSILMNTKQTGFGRDQVIQTCVRAIRNCSWSGALWAKYIFLLSLHLRNKAEVADVYERAVNDPMLSANPEEVTKVCLEYCSFLRRFITPSSPDEVRQALREALTKSQQIIKAAGGDPYYKLERYWINLEAFLLDNPTGARDIWETILDSTKTSASTWLERINMEVRLGDYEKARRLFRMATQVKELDWPTTIYDAWISFEHEHGGVNEVKAAYMAISKLSSSLDQYIAQMYEQATQQSAESVQPAAEAQPVGQYQANQALQTDNVGGKKRKASADHGESSESIGSPAKHQKPARTHHHSKGREEDTCFFKNFSPQTTDEELMELFKQYGTIVRFIVPIDKVKKTRRGYGYVQFSDKSEAQAALALNGRDCGMNRGLIVHISDVTRAVARTEGRPPPMPVERANILEVRGIDNDTSETDLKKLFSLHGEVTDVFIVRKSKVDGHPLAKVTFANEDDAHKALELNGTSFMTHVLKVQPWKVQSQEQFNSNVKKMEAVNMVPRKAESNTFSAPRTVSTVKSFQPRTLGKPKSMPPRSRAFAGSTSSASTNSTGPANQATGAAPAPKTQDDFRKWLQQRQEQARQDNTN
ncbi:Splicing factor [Actinomortierella wolfii]|nr:Splicing factor [Actinomortierella wolfii]